MSSMFGDTVAAAIACICSLISPIAAQERTATQGVGGTYAISICRGQCSPEHPEAEIVRGFLVLEPSSFSLEDLPAPARNYFERYTTILALGENEGPLNTCFTFGPKTDHTTFAGSEPVGVSRWRAARGDTLSITLMRRSHHAYYADVVVRGNELSGLGYSWQGRGDSEPSVVEEIRGRRIGPPDRSRCYRAAERRAAELAPVQPRKDG